MGIRINDIQEVGEDLLIEFLVDRTMATTIVSGFLLKSIKDAARDLDPDRILSAKEAAIQRIEHYIRDASTENVHAKQYALGMADVLMEIGGPDYTEEILARYKVENEQAD